LFRKQKKSKFTTTKIIALGFFVTIIIGTFLLMLPISTASREVTNPIDALFTATTSVCVTGLVTVPTFSHWSVFGQIIIMILAQIGGLGVITFTTMFLLITGKRIGLKERLLIQDAYNLDTIQGLVKIVKRIVKGTLIVEGIGALCYMIVFVPEFGIIGIWKSIFNSVSAFCNAGMDVLGPNSLMSYVDNPIVNITTMVLIILGGIGFPVWWCVIDVIKERKNQHQGLKNTLHHMPLHTKLVVTVTFILIVGGALLIFLLEYDNSNTLGNLPLWQKIQAAFFQSVTTRTAGFLTISQSGLRKGTAILCCIFMFIGGSPSGTAGGVKTTTVAVLVMTVISIMRNRKDTEIYERKINDNILRRALAIFMVSFSVMLISVILLSIVQPGDFLDCLYEGVSAIATVGLSRDLTANLTMAGKIIIIVTMYLGRIGPISLSLLFNTKQFVNLKTYPEEKISVG